MQKITPFLWFNDQAEEAANLYTSLFRDSKITKIARYPEGSPGPAGKVMTVEFELFGQQFTALNGGPSFNFTEAVSFMVNCDSQEEIDKYWETLLQGGSAQQCGWLKDRYGLSWQITPTIMGQLMTDKDKAKTERVMQAMMKMVKLDIATLKAAYEGAA
ncbi:MAG: 3-demethylubiquinone-9 3-methyltransferase [Chitinophagaceae bacterium]|jgi:predicted 3-demethylubiquinone-9 3-methyltransferase (glyoxalase superfamily)|nr:3-demethylubiquinone-9 3-methyltransferase [Chitinophagaceae bacterium]